MYVVIISTSNKRPMGHIAHLINQFKLMNTFERSYDYTYYKIDQVVQEENFEFRECTFAIFVIISHYKKAWPFYLNKLKSSLPRDAFCQVWLKLAQWFFRRRF